MKTGMLEKTKESTVLKWKDKFKTGFKIQKMALGITVLFLLALICVIGQNVNSSSINISAHFSSVTEGKNPDGSPFDIDEILSTEVLDRAVENLGGNIDAQVLKRHLSISDNTSNVDIAKVKHEIIDGNTDYSYYPNVYTLTYSIVSDAIKNDGFFEAVGSVFKQIAMPSQKKILKSIAESYSEYYMEKYVSGNVAMQVDWAETDELDYYNKASQVGVTANKISRFILSKYNNNPEFVSGNGVGYGELYTEIEQIIDVDIDNYMSFIVQNGLTEDKTSLLRQFAFMENLCNESNTRHISAYEVVKEAIDFYDANTTQVVFIPALDDERAFYMNRTKVGIDYLIEKADSEKVLADDALHDAERYKYLTKQFSRAAAVSQKTYDAADEMYINIKNKINEFLKNVDEIMSEGAQDSEYKKLEIGKPHGNFSLVSMAVYGAKVFVLLLIIAFLLASLIESANKIISKRRDGEE